MEVDSEGGELSRLVWWCEQHERPALGNGDCYPSPAGQILYGPCRMVEMLLVPKTALVVEKQNLVWETPCEHGEIGEHWSDSMPAVSAHCPGGSRRVLPEGSLVIEKQNGQWPDGLVIRVRDALGSYTFDTLGNPVYPWDGSTAARIALDAIALAEVGLGDTE